MDRLQIIVVAKNITVLQLFISRMPKMCAIPQLVSAPLNPIPTVEHFRRSHPQCEHSYGQHIYCLINLVTDNTYIMIDLEGDKLADGLKGWLNNSTRERVTERPSDKLIDFT